MRYREVFPRSLQYLIAIAEHGSFTKAAEAMFVSQPTLSQQIKQLEESLQLPLFDRSGRTVCLTDAGQIYLGHARRAWGELESGARAIQNVKDLSRGTLRIGWTPITDFLTCPLIAQFNMNYPGIKLSTLELPANEIEIAVIEDQIDFGIVFSNSYTNIDRSNDIETNTLFKESVRLAVGNIHPRAGQKERIGAKELGRESLVLLNESFALRAQVEQYFSDMNIRPNIAIETDSLSVIIELIQVGPPLATLLPESIIRMQCGIHPIVITPALSQQEITVICRKGGYKSPACMAFAEIASNWTATMRERILVRKRRPCPLSEPNAYSQ